MRVTVYSATRIAIATVHRLIEKGHEVVLIEEDHSLLDEVAETLDCGMIHGDGTLPHILRDAFGDRSDAFVALANEDNKNILAALVARSIGYPRVIPQVSRAELLPIIEELGLNERLTPHDSIAEALVAALEERDRIAIGEILKNELRLVVAPVPPAFEPRPFGDLKLPGTVRGIARIRAEEECLLDPGTDIAPDDQLLFAVAEDDREKLSGLFG